MPNLEQCVMDVLENEDLLGVVAHHLPITSVPTLKAVCPRWNSIVSEAQFLKNYKEKSYTGNIAPGIFVQSSRGVHLLKLNPKWVSFYPRQSQKLLIKYPGSIQHSTNGLLLCMEKDCYIQEVRFFVFNPTTQVYGKIHCLKISGDEVILANLIFTPSPTPEYKALFIHQSRTLSLFSSSTGLYKKLNLLSPPNVNSSTSSVYFNGRLFWVCNMKESWVLDFETEQLSKFELPGPGVGERRYTTRVFFGESKGYLRLVNHEYRCKDCIKCQIYELEDDHHTWKLIHIIYLSADSIRRLGVKWIGGPPLWKSKNFALMNIVTDEEDQTFAIMMVPGYILKYHFQTKSVEKLYITENRNAGIAHLDVYPYIPSLCGIE